MSIFWTCWRRFTRFYKNIKIIFRLLYDNLFIRHIIAPLIFSLIPALVFNYYQSPNSAEWINTNFPLLGNFLGKNVWMSWLALAVPFFAYSALNYFFSSMNKEEGMGLESVLCLLRVIEEEIVGNKLKSLGKNVEAIKSK